MGTLGDRRSKFLATAWRVRLSFEGSQRGLDIFIVRNNNAPLTTMAHDRCRYSTTLLFQTTACIDSTYTCVNESTECSYPFTYGGQVLYRCTQGITELKPECIAYGCYMPNRTLAKCNAPPGNFIVSELSFTLTYITQCTAWRSNT